MGLQQVKNGIVSEDYDFFKDFSKKDYEPWLKKIVYEILEKFYQNARFDFDELMSEGWLALVESAKTFDAKLSNSLLGYAKPYVYKRILEFIGVNMYTLKARYYNVAKDAEKLEALNNVESGIISSVNGNDDDVLDIIPGPSGIDVGDDVARKEQSGIINNALNSKISKRERYAIIRRFKYDESYSDIAKKLGCAAESARYLVNKGLEKLKYSDIKLCKQSQ